MAAQLDGLMMDYPLVLTQFFERSRRLFASKTLATRRPNQPMFRYTYADFAERTRRPIKALGIPFCDEACSAQIATGRVAARVAGI